MIVYHPEDPGVADAAREWAAAVQALAEHVEACQVCTQHNPSRYRKCTAGHDLAAAQLARAIDMQTADAMVSRPGPARGGGR